MRRLGAALGAATIAAAAAVAFTSGVAGATAPDVQGWWTVSNPGSPVPTPPAPPDVPANGLVIEGGPAASSPVSYAAVLYVLSGALPTSLTLTVAPSSGTTPDATVELCPLKSPELQAEQGGPIADAPAYDCKTHVSAQPASSGDHYQFNVATLATKQTLAVAILPTASTDRVVFSAPDANSLSVATSSNGGALPPPASSSKTQPQPAGGSTTGSGNQPVGSNSAATPSYPLPGAGSTTSTAQQSAPVVAPSSGVAPAPAAIPVASATNGAAKSRVVLVVLIAALAGAVAWTSAGNAAVRAVARSLAAPVAGGPEQGSA